MTNVRVPARSDDRVTGRLLDLALIAGVAMGALVVIQRDAILPERFMYDGTRIQEQATGQYTQASDYSFDAIAAVYRELGLAHHPDLASLLGFFGAVGLVLLTRARLRAGGARFDLVAYFLAGASVFFGAVYLGFYSKDVLVLPITALALTMRHHVRSELVFLAAIGVYALEFRSYWALIGGVYVGLRIAWRWIHGTRSLAGFVLLGLLVCVLGVVVVQGLDANHYRDMVNGQRVGSDDATTAIAAFVPSAGLLGGYLNAVVTMVALIVPWPLVLLAQPYYVAVAVIATAVWASALVGARRVALDPALREDTALVRSVSLLLAFLVVQTIFEPDYGSAIRHTTPLLPLVLYVHVATRSSRAGVRAD